MDPATPTTQLGKETSQKIDNSSNTITILLKVEIQTTDTVETATVTMLLDSGATGLFLNTLMQVNVA